MAFIIDVALMIAFNIVGGDATALVGGTAVIVMSIIVIGKGDILASLDEITDMVKEGFIFAIKIFAHVIVIAAFFSWAAAEWPARFWAKAHRAFSPTWVWLWPILCRLPSRQSPSCRR